VNAPDGLSAAAWKQIREAARAKAETNWRRLKPGQRRALRNVIAPRPADRTDEQPETAA